MSKPKVRCVNIDWLEVYVEESNNRYPCNAEYFRKQGYYVNEREYGTRQYAEMFTIVDADNNPLFEVRRNPKSGDSSFSGFNIFSSHIRLANWLCYRDDAVDMLRNFLLRNDYNFKRIFRIDVCYDFERFDSGDIPSKFARRYLERVYRKINQCKIYAIGDDSWSGFDWETLSWGNPTSMVTTKLYCKSKELKAKGDKKPYIYSSWFMHGLIDNPVRLTKRDAKGNIYTPEIWRVEFSMHSAADNWLVIENNDGKKEKKQAVKHTLSMFDTRDKLWQRFQDLAHHYFRFKYREYKDVGKGIASIALEQTRVHVDRELKRKDRCADKILFRWDKGHTFMQIKDTPVPNRTSRDEDILLKRLAILENKTGDPVVKKACRAILDALEVKKMRILTPHMLLKEIEVLRHVIALKTGGDERSTIELIAEVTQLLEHNELF